METGVHNVEWKSRVLLIHCPGYVLHYPKIYLYWVLILVSEYRWNFSGWET